MSKSVSDRPPAIFGVIGKLRPPTATHYRLVDSNNRTFPPQNEPPLHARLRVDFPLVPPGEYGILFENESGQAVPYTEDGALKLIQLNGPEVSASPDDIEFRRERGYHRIEKRENKIREKALRTDTIERLVGLLFESQANAARRDRSMVRMVRTFTEGQRELFAQQNALLKHAATINPPPPPPPEENWPSSIKGIANSIAQLLSTAIQAYGSESPRAHKDSVLDAVSRTSAISSGPNRVPPGVAHPPAEVHPAPAAAPSVAASNPASVPAAAPSLLANAARIDPTKGNGPNTQDPPPASPPQQPSEQTTPQQTSPPADRSDSRIARPEELQDESSASSARRSFAGVAWREIKRRIVGLPENAIVEIVSSRRGFLDWLRWVVEPAALVDAVHT